MSGRILVVDDDEDQCLLLRAQITRLGYHCEATTSPREALQRVESEQFEVVITDLAMTEMDGVALCVRLAAAQPTLRVIVVTGQGSIETAVAAIRAAACDFLQKPVDVAVLGASIEQALKGARLRTELKRVQLPFGETSTNPDKQPARLVGESAAMQRINFLVQRLANTEVSVLLQGETGTGKELVARALHAQSGRAAGPFVAINCAALQPSLLESELFGHARGAFTDARGSRHGLFVAASGGTLFLDEIGEMPLEMQVKLLRAIQERKVRPVGSDIEVPFDARLLSATHRDLEEEVRKHRFREDLFYRINVVKIDVPPLRARGYDTLELANHFLRCTTRPGHAPPVLSPLVAERLLEYSWPGNVRELENCMDCAAALAQQDAITVGDLPASIRDYEPFSTPASPKDGAEMLSIAEIERRHIAKVLLALGGNKARAADTLGVDRRTLYRKLERYANPNAVLVTLENS